MGSGGGVRSVDLTSEACCLVLLLRRLRRDERTVTLKVGTRRQEAMLARVPQQEASSYRVQYMHTSHVQYSQL